MEEVEFADIVVEPVVVFEIVPFEIEVEEGKAVEVEVVELYEIVLDMLEFDTPVEIELAILVLVSVAVAEAVLLVDSTEAVEFKIDVLFAEKFEFPELDEVLFELIVKLLELVDEGDKLVIVELEFIEETVVIVENGYDVEEFEGKDVVIEFKPVAFIIPVLVA